MEGWRERTPPIIEEAASILRLPRAVGEAGAGAEPRGVFVVCVLMMMPRHPLHAPPRLLLHELLCERGIAAIN